MENTTVVALLLILVVIDTIRLLLALASRFRRGLKNETDN